MVRKKHPSDKDVLVFSGKFFLEIAVLKHIEAGVCVSLKHLALELEARA